MKRYIKSSEESKIEANEEVLASSFNRARTHLNEQPCMFITAFRGEYTPKENQKRNKELEAEIKSSGLSYIKAKGGYVENQGTPNEEESYEDTFCVINNKYHTNDFIKLAVHWCGMFDQEGVLVTKPAEIPYGKGDANYRKAISVIGIEYNKNGGINAEYDGVTMSDISKYFTRMCGKSFTLVSSSEHITASEYEIYKPSNAPRFCKIFKEKYPNL